MNGADLPEAAHVQTESGSIKGARPDGREGVPPPPVEQGDIERAANDAGCELQLDLQDEGDEHITEDDPEPNYNPNPPPSGEHIGPCQLDQARPGS